jgi:hypothetical protein
MAHWATRPEAGWCSRAPAPGEMPALCSCRWVGALDVTAIQHRSGRRRISYPDGSPTPYLLSLLQITKERTKQTGYRIRFAVSVSEFLAGNRAG